MAFLDFIFHGWPIGEGSIREVQKTLGGFRPARTVHVNQKLCAYGFTHEVGHRRTAFARDPFQQVELVWLHEHLDSLRFRHFK